VIGEKRLWIMDSKLWMSNNFKHPLV